MIRYGLTLAVFAIVLAPTQVSTQGDNVAMAALAAALKNELVLQPQGNVAVVDFTDLQGRPTELGRFLAEQLSVEMVIGGEVPMLDRTHLKSILDEHKLTQVGLVNAATMKKFGEFSGVDVIVIGTVTPLDSGLVVTVRAIDTGSARIVAAGRTTVANTPDTQALLNRGVQSNVVTLGSATFPASRSPDGPSYSEARPIASTEVGPLRVSLRAATRGTVSGRYARARRTLTATFDVTSRASRPLMLAFNATQLNGYNGGTCRLGPGIRATAVDSTGLHYEVPAANVSGLSVIGVGCENTRAYSPSEIVGLLETQDRRGKRGQQIGEYVYGAWSTLQPRDITRVVVTFIGGPDRIGAVIPEEVPTAFDLNLEFVVGMTDGSTTRHSYALQTVAFERVTFDR